MQKIGYFLSVSPIYFENLVSFLLTWQKIGTFLITNGYKKTDILGAGLFFTYEIC
jgi:hypothetical protein